MSNVSLSDLLTAIKNVVTALNNASQTYLNINGLQNNANITSATVVKSSSGRLAMISVIAGGSSNGTIYDATSTASTSTPIFTIPDTPGVFFANLPVTNGIVVVPGSGQVVTISYS
jgi:hypothetical protein